MSPITVGPTDFSHGAELIERAHALTSSWLTLPRPGPGQASLLLPRTHDT